MDSFWIKTIFAPLCVLSLGLILLAIWQDGQQEWKHYQKNYYSLAASMSSDPAQREQILEMPIEIKQIQTRVGGRVDRCVSCHLGVDNPNFANAAQPYRTHPKLQRFREVLHHSLDDFGCTFCHGGQGLATTQAAAHGRVPHWDRPLLTGDWLEIGCGRCHKGTAALEGAPILSKGRRLARQVGCHNCHAMEGFEQEKQGAFGPDLRAAGLKLNEDWLRKWLKDPFAFKAKTKMLNFYLSDEEAGAIARFLMTLKGPETVEAAAQSADRQVAKGRELFGELRCFFCHKMEGFEKEDMAPDLTGFGLKNAMNLDFGRVTDTEYTLKDWTKRKIREPRAFETKEAALAMPGNDLEEDEITALTVLLLTFTGDEVPSAYRRRETYGDDEGKRLFDELKCAGCHNVGAQGIAGGDGENVAADLSNVGAKTKVEWMFQWLKDPSSIYGATRMPTIGFLTETRALRLTGYVMSFREKVAAEAQPARMGQEETLSSANILEGRKVFEDMECYRCHRIAGRGGELAPELSRIGEKVTEEWLLQWLAEPENYNLSMLDDRPITLSDEQVQALTRYLLSLRGPAPLYPPRVPEGALLIKEKKDDETDTVERGRRLFGEGGPVQYLFGKRVGTMGLGCYGCHRLGDRGNDIGPDLREEGSKVKRDWLLQWLKDPLAHSPDTKMGDFHLTDDEATALTDYLMTYRSSPASEEVVASGATPSDS
jgi:mono/diheme cytochrome c family protein